MPARQSRLRPAVPALLVLLAACGGERRAGDPRPGTLVVAAIGEPSALLPPLVYESVGRDIGDLVYERLADLAAGGSPVDPAAFRPALAERWERVDSLTWRFRLRPGARWHDGRPVTGGDVRFSFEAFADPVLDAPARPHLEGRMRVEVEDSATVRVRFTEPSPEQLYDATYHVRVLPAHVWERLPRDRWAADTMLARLVGSGPYRVREWRRGEYAVLERHPGAARPGNIARVVWRFASDPDAALNLVLSGEADLLEQVGPLQLPRARGDAGIELRPYPGATYGFLAFRLADSAGRPHPVFGDRLLRRALALAVDRPTVAQALFGPEAAAPEGPMSQLLWINDPAIRTLPYDSALAARLLDEAGWRSAPDGRRRDGRRLGFDILVPATSSVRRQAAVMLQEYWRRAGAEVTVTQVDFAVFQERIRTGRFDTYIGAYLDEPSARGLADQWTRAGWKALNYGRYANPAFDSLFARAGRAGDPAAARRLYREALDTLNADAPGLFLYAPASVALVRRRLQGVEINPFSWLSGLPEWRVADPDGLALGR